MIYSMLVCPSGFFPDQLHSPAPPPEEFFFLAARLSFSPADLFFVFDNPSIVHQIRLCAFAYLSICGDGQGNVI